MILFFTGSNKTNLFMSKFPGILSCTSFVSPGWKVILYIIFVDTSLLIYNFGLFLCAFLPLFLFFIRTLHFQIIHIIDNILFICVRLINVQWDLRVFMISDILSLFGPPSALWHTCSTVFVTFSLAK